MKNPCRCERFLMHYVRASCLPGSLAASPQRTASELLAVTWPALQISNLQKPHRLIAPLVCARNQLRDTMAEKKSAAPSHPPYSALVKEAILSLKVGPRPDCPPVAAISCLKQSLKLCGAVVTCKGRSWPFSAVSRSDVVQLLAGEKWLFPPSHYKARGREAPRFAWTLEEGPLQPRPEAETLGQVGPGNTQRRNIELTAPSRCQERHFDHYNDCRTAF